jgi:competence protein CoiA
MLSAVCDAIGKRVMAKNFSGKKEVFRCPFCFEEVILKRGARRTHHFAHKTLSACAAGSGESALHHLAKIEIYESLTASQGVFNCEVEKRIGNSIADVFASIGGASVAIEVQRSNLSEEDIYRRTEGYGKLGVSVLWVSLHRKNKKPELYSPRPWERWCHALYFGRIYKWVQGDFVRPIHLSPYEYWAGGGEWYDSDGEYNSSEPYLRTSRRWKVPVPSSDLRISSDFSCKRKSACSFGVMKFPNCSIFMDKQNSWWKKQKAF